MSEYMADKSDSYEDELRRNFERQYGPGVKTPNISGVPIQSQPIAARIAELSKIVAETGHQLTDARSQFQAASIRKGEAEQDFAEAAENLMRAIQEHREGPPPGVLYQP
jgi:hypothetical protein